MFIGWCCVNQNAVYEMRIGTWSSSVCSSDLIKSGVSVEPSRTPLTLRPQPISHAAHGMQQGLVAAIVQLATQAADMHVDDVGAGIEMIVPDAFQQHGSRHHLVWMAQEIFQQAELAR